MKNILQSASAGDAKRKDCYVTIISIVRVGAAVTAKSPCSRVGRYGSQAGRYGNKVGRYGNEVGRYGNQAGRYGNKAGR